MDRKLFFDCNPFFFNTIQKQTRSYSMVTKFKPLNYKNVRNTTDIFEQKVVNKLSTMTMRR